MRRILIIDDELASAGAASEFSKEFPVPGFVYDFAGSMQEAERLMSSVTPSLVLLDIRFEGAGDTHGLDILGGLIRERPEMPVVMMSSRREPEILVRSWDLGARGYLLKWSDNAKFHEELTEKVARLALEDHTEAIVGTSPPICRLRKLIDTVAAHDTTVLIEGETGTGKELVVEAIHGRSGRAGGPLVKINCGALPESLIASELFGYRKGSFTGAAGDRPGKVEEAAGGVLFLDEIGEIKPDVQIALLRFLDRREFSRVGEARTRTVDVRIVAATNRRLKQEVEAGGFRHDLYQRLNLFRIETSPLRNCREDIPLLALHFLSLQKRGHPKPVSTFAPETMAILQRYDWPGNVRELANVVARAYVMTASGHIESHALPDDLLGIVPTSEGVVSLTEGELQRSLGRVTWMWIRRLADEERRTQGRYGLRKRIARRLGLNPVNGLGRRLAEIRRECPELHAEIDAIFPAHWDPKLRIPRGQVVAAASIVSPKY